MTLMFKSARRAAVALTLAAAMLTPGIVTAAPRIAVLDFAIVDTSGEPRDQTADHARRLAELRDFVAAELARRTLYDVVDLGPIRPAVDAALGLENLHACNGCDIVLGRKAGADRVLVGWVKKVSTLVMSFEAEIRDTATGRPLVHKSLDFRGDNDAAWQRMASYLVNRLAELPPSAR
ncbi:DUF3280 domain-containing protein [Chthonobacter albigriseus]|uniref:DUF3280 domain-containing protein n=1 Tax=Chthonobacter albigriseus TaxID=1683161 RepID=UPI0015EE7BF0|nr:DUF3280 domain-containing protein [Chthonobacter albigriseus]